MSITLRPYQRDILNDPGISDVLRWLARTGPRPDILSSLITAPTGSGKTAMFASLCKWCADRSLRVYIIVHRREIMEQTLAALFRLGVTAGQIAAGRPITREYIQVGMAGTLIHRLESLPRPDLLISDEAHHDLEGNARGRIFLYWKDVPRLGFTASPERLDGRGMCETYRQLILGPSISDLVAQGWLAPPVLFRPPQENIGRYHVKRGDFDTQEQAQVMSGRVVVGNVIEHYREHLDGLPTVAFCPDLVNARMFAKEFQNAGYTSRVVWGNMPTSEREAAIKGLADGSVQVVTSCDVISEGVDVPVMVGAIMLRRTLSLALYLQQAGRALRPVFPPGFDAATASPEERILAMGRAGKPRAIILDHAGNYQLHGHVLADREWTLDARPRSERQERPPTTTTCPKCYGVWPGVPRKCPDPECGYVFGVQREAEEAEVKTIAGTLIEAGVEEGEAEKINAAFQKAMKMNSAQDRQRALLGAAFKAADKRVIDELGKAAGYSEKWSDWAWRYRTEKMKGGRA